MNGQVKIDLQDGLCELSGKTLNHNPAQDSEHIQKVNWVLEIDASASTGVYFSELGVFDCEACKVKIQRLCVIVH